LGVSSSFYW